MTTGTTELVAVKAAKSYWEQMQQRLDAPIIREILSRARGVRQAAAETDIGKQAAKVSEKLRNHAEDMREVWHTSQNPVVTIASGFVENMTGDTEEGLATQEILKKDPGFRIEEWAAEVKKNLAPLVIKAHLEGDTKTLRPHLTQAVYSRLAAEIRTRKTEGVIFDSNILAFDENSVSLKFLESGGAVIMAVYMVQQINCIKNKKGEILEVSNMSLWCPSFE